MMRWLRRFMGCDLSSSHDVPHGTCKNPLALLFRDRHVLLRLHCELQCLVTVNGQFLYGRSLHKFQRSHWIKCILIYLVASPRFDALAGYLSALAPEGTASDKLLDTAAAAGWPATHVIGKDILRFHAVYWPGMLPWSSKGTHRTPRLRRLQFCYSR